MVRPAAVSDLDGIESSYLEHFAHERKYGAVTTFQEGVYPTRADAENAIKTGTMYVCEENGIILGSVILNRQQPKDYENACWPSRAAKKDVSILRLLMVRPSAKKQGVGTALIEYLCQVSREWGCTALRLHTGIQNFPAISLYRKSGFLEASSQNRTSSMDMRASAPSPQTPVVSQRLYFEKII